MKADSSILIDEVSIAFGAQTIVLDINLSIKAGEFVCLLGPSGCGKSTLLNAIAGFLPYQGVIRVNGAVVRGPGTDRGVVFQNSEVLFPWLTARENVEYGLKIKGVPKKERYEAAHGYLSLVGLGHAIDKFPAELSGGMCQRLQLARVLVNEPSVVLMDEPFGALDAQTREVMQHELDRIWRTTKSTIVFVTHDIGEAILLADRVVTMTAGPAARIKAVRPIDVARPRDETDPAVLGVYRELRDDIGEEVGKAMRQQELNEEQR